MNLADLLREQSTAADALRILWALHAVGGTNESLLLECMDSPHDVVRGWAVQLELEDRQASPQALAKLALTGSTRLVALGPVGAGRRSATPAAGRPLGDRRTTRRPRRRRGRRQPAADALVRHRAARAH